MKGLSFLLFVENIRTQAPQTIYFGANPAMAHHISYYGSKENLSILVIRHSPLRYFYFEEKNHPLTRLTKPWPNLWKL